MVCFLYPSKSMYWKVLVGTMNLHIILIYIYIYMHVCKHMYHVFYNLHTVSFSTHQPWSKGRCNLFTCSQAFAAIHTQVKPQVAMPRCLGGGWNLGHRPCFIREHLVKVSGAGYYVHIWSYLLLKSVQLVAVNYCICVGKCIHYMLHYIPAKSLVKCPPLCSLAIFWCPCRVSQGCRFQWAVLLSFHSQTEDPFFWTWMFSQPFLGTMYGFKHGSLIFSAVTKTLAICFLYMGLKPLEGSL